MTVQPMQLIEIENRRRRRDPLQGNSAARSDMVKVSRVPPPRPSQATQDNLSAPPAVHPSLEMWRSMSLHGASTVAFYPSPRMVERCANSGTVQSERLVDGDLFRRVGKMIVAANHVSDLHQRIINGNDIVIDRHAASERTRMGRETASAANSTAPRTMS